MIILIHQNAQRVVQVIKEGVVIPTAGTSCSNVIWKLAEKFPDEIIGWCEETNIDNLNLKFWSKVFHQELIMASYSNKNVFLPDSIGFIDQLPFVNVNRNVMFPTWQMSSDVGGINGETLLKFKTHFEEIKDFDFLLNSIAKIGQQNGLLCYSAPDLLKNKAPDQKLETKASIDQVFSFVYRFYNTIWIFIIFWCYWKYLNKLYVRAFIQAFIGKKQFLLKVDLSAIKIQTLKVDHIPNSIDVVIPTMGRDKYLTQVIKDLSVQSLLPKKVIIVEQNSDINSKSKLSELLAKPWPFEITHYFIHQTGACNARNLALREIESEWVFFADDDIRLQNDILKKTIIELRRLGVTAINMNCLQKGEKTIFMNIKQWGSFGSGSSIVQSKFATQCAFSSIFEYGYGEDIDYGMQLRNIGCDIIYHPNIEILHLKAPIGGFREKILLAWEQEQLKPKPSPTLLAFAYKFYTPQQINGFKISLFLKYYSNQSIKNPVKYFRIMRSRWRVSDIWAKKLIQDELDVIAKNLNG